MNKQGLKPCPFCGHKTVSIQSEADHPEYGSGGRYYYVKCPSCRAKSGIKYAHEVCPIFYSEVRQEWNNRAEPPMPFIVSEIEWRFIRFTELSKNQRMKCKIAWTDGYNSVIYDEEGVPQLVANWAFEVLEGVTNE